jgi:hypothetical protein
METITVLDPTGKAGSKEFPAAPRPGGLDGRVLGVLWNGKPNGDILLERVRAALAGRYRLKAMLWRKKPAVDLPAGPLLAELAAEADFIVNGIGD